MVRVVGLEPTLLAEPDFESGASTNFTTPAWPVSANGKIMGPRPAENQAAHIARRLPGRLMGLSLPPSAPDKGWNAGP